MVHSSLTLLARNAIKSFQYQLPLQFEFDSLDGVMDYVPPEAIAQLESEVAKLEKYGQELLARKQQQGQEILQETVNEGITNLEIIADKINHLAVELENQLSNFKEIAVEINRSYHLLQESYHIKPREQKATKPPRPANIWEVHNSAIPVVVKQGKKFILTTKTVNLFQAEESVDVKAQARTAQKRRKSLEAWLTKS
ncbi:hypothetical protein ACQFX9_22565 [Aliinostoc sp. HNIBRCY26]|uniref:hypothetical protein n=1 Tax=Aliinostoc sp. HNIBRCY26 TaxID=3418997 RepID=UPI003D0820E4